MAALSAIRSNPILRRFYQQLRQRNKPTQSGLGRHHQKTRYPLEPSAPKSFFFASHLNTVATVSTPSVRHSTFGFRHFIDLKARS
jgi:hypothetical protein